MLCFAFGSGKKNKRENRDERKNSSHLVQLLISCWHFYCSLSERIKWDLRQLHCQVEGPVLMEDQSPVPFCFCIPWSSIGWTWTPSQSESFTANLKLWSTLLLTSHALFPKLLVFQRRKGSLFQTLPIQGCVSGFPAVSMTVLLWCDPWHTHRVPVNAVLGDADNGRSWGLSGTSCHQEFLLEWLWPKYFWTSASGHMVSCYTSNSKSLALTGVVQDMHCHIWKWSLRL